MATILSVFNKLHPTSRHFLYYYRRLSRELVNKGWDRHNTSGNFEVEFEVRTFGYNYEAYTLLQKSFKRMGWSVIMKRYALVEKNKNHQYVFIVERNAS